MKRVWNDAKLYSLNVNSTENAKGGMDFTDWAWVSDKAVTYDGGETTEKVARAGNGLS